MGLKEKSKFVTAPKHVWAPLPGAQSSILNCPIREILLDGNRGGGKTDCLLMKFAKYAGRGLGPLWRGVIFTPRYKNLEEVIAKGKRWFYQSTNPPRFLSSKSDYKFVWRSGEELVLRALEKDDDYWQHHGHEYPFVGFEELTKWPNSFLYDAVSKSLNRVSVKGVPRFVVSTTNPYGAGYLWVKRRFVDPAPTPSEKGNVMADKKGRLRCRITCDLRKNHYLMDASPDYLDMLESIENDGLREAWLHGRWDINVGFFWEGYWTDKNIVEPFMPPLNWKRWRAMDWGFARPYSIGWYTISPDGEIYRYRELYGYGGGQNKGSREHAADVARKVIELEKHEREAGCKFLLNPADSQIFAGIGHETTIGQTFAMNGCYWIAASKGPGSRVVGWDQVRQRLREKQFMVTRDCVHFLRTFPYLMPDDDNWEDVDTEQEDHAADECRYSLMSRHKPKKIEDQTKLPGDNGQTSAIDWMRLPKRRKDPTGKITT